jgi:hypothetical protein
VIRLNLIKNKADNNSALLYLFNASNDQENGTTKKLQHNLHNLFKGVYDIKEI